MRATVLALALASSLACAAELPLVVQHLSGAPVATDEPPQPVSWGVPLPRGAVATADQLRLLGPDGKALPCQFDAMARARRDGRVG